MAKNLRIAAAALIVSIVLFIPYIILSFARMASGGLFDNLGEDVSFSLPGPLVILYYIMAVAVIIVTILWIRGFILIGKHLENRSLVVSSWCLLITVIAYNLLDLIPGVSLVVAVAGGIIGYLNGIALIFFGVAILPLLEKLGGIATAYGVLLIVQGTCIVLILLLPVAALLEIPVCVVGVIVLYTAATKL